MSWFLDSLGLGPSGCKKVQIFWEIAFEIHCQRMSFCLFRFVSSIMEVDFLLFFSRSASSSSRVPVVGLSISVGGSII